MIEQFHAQYAATLSRLYEWCLEWPAALARLRGEELARACSARAETHWKTASSSIATCELGRSALATLSLALSSGNVRLGTNGLAPLLAELARLRDEGSLEKLRAYARAAHDGMIQFAQSYPVCARDLAGQALAEQLVHESRAGCSFHAPMWDAAEKMTPRQLTDFLAGNLRAHFSGAGREGEVEVVEEAERFRIVAAPCGSGGALRQRARPEGGELFQEASPVTWGRAGEVPAYCTHCAWNELHALERLGYPAVVTEFDPNPKKPCGWTVYKDPTKIPARYFERLGRKKPG